MVFLSSDIQVCLESVITRPDKITRCYSDQTLELALGYYRFEKLLGYILSHSFRVSLTFSGTSVLMLNNLCRGHPLVLINDMCTDTKL
jgi:hypothetical protein